MGPLIKIVSKTFFFIVLISFSISFGAMASLNEVQACLEEIRTNPIPEKSQEIINRCYDKALPWATSSSVQGKFLYVQVLQSYLNIGSDRSSRQALAQKLSNYYLNHLDAEITSSSIQAWSDSDIETVFNGFTAVEFFTSRVFEVDVALEKYKNVFENLEERNLATEMQAHYLYSALLANGQWEKARSVLKRWPQLSPTQLPMIEDKNSLPPSSLGYFVVSPDLKTMSLKQFDPSHGPKIVLSGFCHLAEDLIRGLAKEPEISQIMKQSGLVINPNEFGEFDFQKMDSLRKEFPNFEIHPVNSSGAWFSWGIHTLSSPFVLFLLDGQPKYQMNGVGKYSVKDFCIGLESIGLSAPKSCAN